MKQIELANGKGFALVDDEDYEWLNGYKWFLATGYAGRNDKRQPGNKQPTIFMHRQILGLSKGDGKEGDHINGNRLDNRRQNLRVCTYRQNGYNRKKYKGFTSKYKGVSRSGKTKKWYAQITHDGVRYCIGYFDDETEAAIAYDHEARKLFGEFANLNFPDIDRPAQGQGGITAWGKSKYFGVSWNTQGQKWKAAIKYQKNTLHLGYFESEEDAARAFDNAARKYRGPDTRTNFH